MADPSTVSTTDAQSVSVTSPPVGHPTFATHSSDSTATTHQESLATRFHAHQQFNTDFSEFLQPGTAKCHFDTCVVKQQVLPKTHVDQQVFPETFADARSAASRIGVMTGSRSVHTERTSNATSRARAFSIGTPLNHGNEGVNSTLSWDLSVGGTSTTLDGELHEDPTMPQGTEAREHFDGPQSWSTIKLSPSKVDLSLLEGTRKPPRNTAEHERLTRQAFHRSGGFTMSERLVEKVQRILQRTGKMGQRRDNITAEALKAYDMVELYKLSTAEDHMVFALQEIHWLESRLLELHKDTILRRIVRTPEFLEADKLGASGSNAGEDKQNRPFHKVFCIMHDLTKVVEGLELVCGKWNKPDARILDISDFLITHQDFTKRLKVMATVEFRGIPWRLHFTTQAIWKVDEDRGAWKTMLDSIQLQFLTAAIQNKPEGLQSLMENPAVEAIANPNQARDPSGLAGLHHAAIHGNLEIAELLIHAQADPWLQDNNCRPPLYFALRFGRKEIAEYLTSLMVTDKGLDTNLIATCSCLEFEWDDQCPLLPSVAKLKTYIKARYIELISENRLAEFCQLSKFTKVYIEDPSLLRIVLPHATATAAALLQALGPDAIVDLSHLNITGQTVRDLADSLSSETPIGHLDFRSNKDLGLNPDDGIGIARIVSLAPQLQVLVLEDCGFTPESFHSLATRLEHRGILQRISFKRNRFMGHEPISGVGLHTIMRIRSAKQLDFSLCGWYSVAAEAMCKRLQSFTNVRSLYLDNNPYIGTKPSFGETMAKILIYAQKLDVFSVSGCDISSEVMTFMGATLLKHSDSFPQVRCINFQKNIRLGDLPEAGNGLAVLLSQCECLNSINLSYIGMTPSAMLSLGKTLHEMRGSRLRTKGDAGTCSVRTIDFGNNYKLSASLESGIGIAYLLMDCARLLEFDMTGCHLSPEAMQSLGESLHQPISARKITWCGNWHIGSAQVGGRGLGIFLQRATSLQEMDLTQCGLTSESLGALGDAIDKTINLHKITLHGNNAVGMKKIGGGGLGKLLLRARSLESFYFTNCTVSTEFIDGLRESLEVKDKTSPPIISSKYITLQINHPTQGVSAATMGEMLANLFMAARYLRSCELERCQLDSVTMAKLGVSVTGNVAVKKISFAKNDAIGAFPAGGAGIGQFLRNAVHLEEISLKQTGFSPQGTESLGIALLKAVLSLKTIDMSNNPRLGSAAVAGRGIAYLLRSCPQLELLNLSCCNFGSDGIARCSALVSQDWTPLGVKRLNFQGNTELAQHLDGGAALGTFLSLAYNLEWLNLSRCGLSSVAVQAMVNHAQSYNALRVLDISESYIAQAHDPSKRESTGPGGKDVAQFLNLGTRIKVLRMSECGISSNEMFEFGSAVKPNELEDVDLSNNDLSDYESGHGLGLFLQHSPKLQELNLKHCGIGFEAIRALINTRGFKLMPFLSKLLLASNPLGGRKESGTLLGELLAKCPKLSVLELRNCGLSADSLGNLGPALSRKGSNEIGARADRERTKLQVVDLSFNANLGESGIMGKGLAGVVNSLTIHEINLTCCGLTANALSVLLENLHDHRSKTIKKMLFAGNSTLGKSPDSGRILFQLLLKFRVQYIDCSGCGITSQAAECLGKAVDAWQARTMSKCEESSYVACDQRHTAHTTVMSASGSHFGHRDESDVVSRGTVATFCIGSASASLSKSTREQGRTAAYHSSRMSTFRTQDGSALKISPGRFSPVGLNFGAYSKPISLPPRLVRSVVLEPKLYGILEEIDLSNNPEMLTTQVAGESVGKLLTFAETIEEVRLSNCGIIGEAIIAMSDYVEQMHILNLDLSRNPSIATDEVGAEGLQTIFSNPKIEEVNLTDCRIPMEYAPAVW